jgi:hypothetical protein
MFTTDQTDRADFYGFYLWSSVLSVKSVVKFMNATLPFINLPTNIGNQIKSTRTQSSEAWCIMVSDEVLIGVKLMDTTQIRETILRELPSILEEDAEIQQLVLRLSRQQFADKAETDSRFDRILDELRRDREAQERKWETQDRKWDEQNRKWDEQNRKWDENQGVINSILAEIREMNRKHESSIGALGARWGLQSEAAFRDGLKAILEDSFPVEVLRVLEFDQKGEVFGRPDQIELDLIIQNGMVIACELKSSMSKPDVHAFLRKVEFYERLHQQPITRRLIISPMVHPLAKETADRLGIEVYGYARDVEL